MVGGRSDGVRALTLDWNGGEPFIDEFLRLCIGLPKGSQGGCHRECFPCGYVRLKVPVVVNARDPPEVPELDADFRFWPKYVVIGAIYPRKCEWIMVAKDKDMAALRHLVCERPLVLLFFRQVLVVCTHEVANVPLEV